ncbi:MmyB family transcriptional regulator [Streptomyces sp. NBC_00536]|uniref:MmyB family transcriptional regulator n=1 Tax=Streptomyces sp. NBC_00536 TaxID=2975769 RepID=UPI003FCD87B3
MAAWGRHITESLRARATAHPDPELDALHEELASYLPPTAPASASAEHLGFAVPLRLRTAEGELRLLTTLTSFATAVDVTLAELHLEAFLPADTATADLLRRREEGRRVAV